MNTSPKTIQISKEEAEFWDDMPDFGNARNNEEAEQDFEPPHPDRIEEEYI